MARATFEWDDENIGHIAYHNVEVETKRKPSSIAGHWSSELETKDTWPMDKRMKAAICWSYLFAKPDEFALSRLGI